MKCDLYVTSVTRLSLFTLSQNRAITWRERAVRVGTSLGTSWDKHWHEEWNTHASRDFVRLDSKSVEPLS